MGIFDSIAGASAPAMAAQAAQQPDFNTLMSKMIEMQNPLASKLMPQPGDSSGTAFMKKLGTLLSSTKVGYSNGHSGFGFEGNTRTPGDIEMLKFLQGMQAPKSAKNPATATNAVKATGGLVGPGEMGQRLGGQWAMWDKMMLPQETY